MMELPLSIKLIGAGVGFLLVESLRSLSELHDLVDENNAHGVKNTLSYLREGFSTIEVNGDYLLYEEVGNGSYHYLDTFDTKVDAVNYINDMKVNIRSR